MPAVACLQRQLRWQRRVHLNGKTRNPWQGLLRCPDLIPPRGRPRIVGNSEVMPTVVLAPGKHAKPSTWFLVRTLPVTRQTRSWALPRRFTQFCVSVNDGSE